MLLLHLDPDVVARCRKHGKHVRVAGGRLLLRLLRCRGSRSCGLGLSNQISQRSAEAVGRRLGRVHHRDGLVRPSDLSYRRTEFPDLSLGHPGRHACHVEVELGLLVQEKEGLPVVAEVAVLAGLAGLAGTWDQSPGCLTGVGDGLGGTGQACEGPRPDRLFDNMFFGLWYSVILLAVDSGTRPCPCIVHVNGMACIGGPYQ
jgi:hypothetical protein